MAKGRGLNKGRGLGSLIPPKVTDIVPTKMSDDKDDNKTIAEKSDASVFEIPDKPGSKAKKAEEKSSEIDVRKAAKTKPAVSATEKKKTEVSATEKKKASAPVTEKKKVSASVTEKKKVSASVTEKKKKAASAAEKKKTAVSETKKKKTIVPEQTVNNKEVITAPEVDKSAENLNVADTSVKKSTEDSLEEVISVRITEVVPNREQPRKRFDENSIEELADSIREHGIVTPLIVQKKGRYYELIAGERRWRAAKMAGLRKVPVILRSFSEEQAAEIALIENIQRENLNAMEEAMAFRRLQEEFSLKQEDIAKRVSRSRSAITNSLRLLKLEEHVQEMLAEGRLSMGHARALLSLENPEMQKITAEQVAENDLSVRETEKLVKQLLAPKKPVKPRVENEQLATIYHDLEEQLRKSIGTRVSIQPIKGKKGKIEIEYYSDEDLERIIAQLRQS